jgi:glc operon protein GlcG
LVAELRLHLSARESSELKAVALAGSLLVSTTAQAQAVLDAKMAQAIIAGCVAQSTPKMQSHAIVVVDTGGHLLAALRMDGNGSGIMDFALAKAEAAAAWGFSTTQMQQSVKGTPGFAYAPHVVTVPGGVPVYSTDGKVRIGGVGVSGEAPADDAACAEAGVRAAGLRTSHS